MGWSSCKFQGLTILTFTGFSSFTILNQTSIKTKIIQEKKKKNTLGISFTKEHDAPKSTCEGQLQCSASAHVLGAFFSKVLVLIINVLHIALFRI